MSIILAAGKVFSFTLRMGTITEAPSINLHKAFSGFKPPVKIIPEIFGMDMDATEERQATITSHLSPGVIIRVPCSILSRKFLSCIAATVKL